MMRHRDVPWATMRTTLDIEDDVITAARALAASEGSSLGRVVSRLARRGLAAASRVNDAGLPAFVVPQDAPPLTLDLVRRALDEE